MKVSIIIKWVLFFTIISNNVCAQDINALRKTHFNATNSLGAKGYDVVSYFISNKAVKGNKIWSFNYGNVVYYFSSLANFNLFKANPSRYEPQYGGWCAYAMGTTGERWDIDPKTFKIVDGKLYLFYNKGFNNTMTSWNKNETKFLADANQKWRIQFK